MATQVSIAAAINNSSLSTSDKRALMAIYNGLTDDLASLTAQFNALLTKLDTAGGTVAALGTNNVATLALAKTSLNIKKS